MELSEHGLALARAYQQRDAVLQPGPIYLTIETTSHCNLACIMCPQPRMGRKKRHLDPALFRRIIDQAAGQVEFAWLHLFGEPLTNRDFPDLARYAAEHGGGMRIGVSTNVTLLNDERAAMLAGLPLDILLLSMDGISAATYEQVRVKGDFAGVVDNVRRFADAWLRAERRPRNVVVSFIDLPILQDDTRDAAEFWARIVPPQFVLNRKPFQPWALQDALTDDVIRRVGADPTRRERTTGCHEFFRGMAILSDGRCVPCCNDYEGRIVLGDAGAQPLAEIWNGPALQRLRREHVPDNALCRYCPQYAPLPEHATLAVSPFQPWNELQGYVSDNLTNR